MKSHSLTILLTAMFMSMTASVASAYDFEVDGIYYNITSSTTPLTVQVTKNPRNHDYTGNVTIPRSVTYSRQYYRVTCIGDSAFYNCSGLTSVTIPNSVTSIGNDAFHGCNGLTSISIPEGVTSIGNDAFHGCNGLTSISIPEGVTSIGNGAFNSCNGMTSIGIPEGVTSIGNNAFSHCSDLTSVTIPNSVTSIGNNAFGFCTSLTSITIGSGVTSIGYKAFDYCSNLISVTLDSNAIVSASRTSSTSMESIFGEQVGSYILGASINVIGSYAFCNCNKLNSITIPNSVTSIGERAFQSCDIWTITIPNSVTSIGENAFANCSKLNSIKVETNNTVYDSRDNCNAIIETSTNTLIAGCKHTTIPNSVTSIGKSAFYGCTGLTSFTIPGSVTSIGNYAFFGCSSLMSVNITDFARWCNISFGNVNANPLSCSRGPHLYLNGVFIEKDLIIPEGITSISDYAFCGYNDLTSVIIDNNVTSIGKHAFAFCEGLTTVIIGNSVTSIGESAFCALTSNTTSLATVTIGNNVVSIGSDAFKTCSNLKKVIVPDISAWCGISFGNNLANPLSYAHHLYSSESTEIKDLSIPNGVITIGSYTFNDCSALTSVTIPNSVTSIGNNAFSGCVGLTDVYCYAETIPNTNSNAFENSPIESETLHVPAASVESYRTTSPWSGFGSIVAADIPVDIPATSISLNPTTLSFNAVNQTATLTATISPSNATNKNVTWTSSNTSVATVSDTGLVTPRTNGTATITATTTDGTNLTASCEVTVSLLVLATGITLNHNTLSFTAINQTATLTATVTPSNAANKNVTWTSSNTSVATVSDTGVVTSKAYGTAIITATTTDGTNLSATCVVTINDSFIAFADPAVKAICVANWDINGDSELSKEEAVQVTDIGSVFKDNTEIKFFNELQYFTRVTTISMSAFENCTSLDSVSIPISIHSIGSYAFQNCKSLTSLVIPNSVTCIDHHAFAHCVSLDSVVIPNSVSELGGAAFEGCSGLTSVSIPNSIESIESNVFNDCGNLTSVTVKRETPPSIVESSFTNRRNAILYVPDGCKAAYKAANYWKDFKIIKDGNDVDVVGISLNQTSLAFNATNQTATLIATVMPSNATNKEVTWASSNTSVATVSNAGVVTSKGNGTATITATTTDGTNLSATCEVTVLLPVLATGISLNQISLSFNAANQTATLIATVVPSNASNKDVTWTSSNTSVATVSSTGVVTSLANGTAIITAKTTDGTNLSAICSVIVLINHNITISDVGYATFFDSKYDWILPSGLSAQVVTGVSNNKLTYEKIYEEIVPKGTAVMLVGQQGTYTLTATANMKSYTGTNLLHGSDEATMTTGDGYHYKLSYGKTGTTWDNVFGWYWGAQDGAPFQIEGHKAWLVVPASASIRAYGYSLDDDDATGITDMEFSDENHDIYYDIQGRRISTPANRGIYIKNGKKVVNK